MPAKDKIIHAAISAFQKQTLEEIAEEHDVSVSSIVRVAIGQWIIRWKAMDSPRLNPISGRAARKGQS